MTFYVSDCFLSDFNEIISLPSSQGRESLISAIQNDNKTRINFKDISIPKYAWYIVYKRLIGREMPSLVLT